MLVAGAGVVAVGFADFSFWDGCLRKWLFAASAKSSIKKWIFLPSSSPSIQSIHPSMSTLSIHPSILHLKARDSSCHGSETALEMAVTDQKTEVAKLLHSIMMVLPNESKGPRQKKKATKGGKT